MSKTIAWIEVFAGVWLIIAPFVLKYSSTTGAMWNDIIIGLIVGILGLVSVFGSKSGGGQVVSSGGPEGSSE